ncbi:MAG: TetR/AcrR family transcriptional regulator C-terminal domain-containing protein [Actinomycetota bacterium]
MVDRILGAVEFVETGDGDDDGAPDDGTTTDTDTDSDVADWRAAITHLAVAEHRLILAHPWVASVMNTVFPRTGRWRLAEELLRLLTLGGFTGHLRDLGYHAITLHVGGFTQQQIGYQFTPEREAEMYARFHRDVTEDVYPLMVDHVRYHEVMDTIPGERPDEFRFVLDLILEGLERRRDDP